MFKYPLSVTVDTNIFDAAKFDLSENSTIRLLENYVKDGKIQVVLSDIVIRESKKHISDQIKRVCGIIRQSRTDILKVSTENLIKYVGLNEILNVVRNKDALTAKGEQIFDNFVSAINAEILGAELIDVNSILELYHHLKIAKRKRMSFQMHLLHSKLKNVLAMMRLLQS